MDSLNQEIFSKVVDALRTKVSDFNFKNWFQNMAWEADGQEKVVVKVPSKFIRDWIQDHYFELIKFELFRHTGKEHKIAFKVDRHTVNNLELFPAIKNGETADHNELAHVNRFVGQKAKSERQKDSQAQVAKLLGFNTGYSFENFVVGNSNQLVHAACQAVAHQPAKSYNPLFIYGGVGLGKTHLINAVGLDVHRKNPSWRIVYVTGEQFTNEVISAIRYDKTFELRKKYRENCDVLLIDDIQFIAGKERTQEEFFHTFNTLYEARKQIVLTSDRLPKDILNLEERLRSRFCWGLLADIQPPDFETRIAILQRKAEKEGARISQEVCEFVAENISANVRDLEGALIRVIAFASLSKIPVTLDLAKDILHDIVSPTVVKVSIESIQSQVSSYYNIRISDLKSKRRHKNLAVPRQIAMYLCKMHLGSSFPEIGHKFGGKDHTTVMHAVSKIKACLSMDPAIQSDVGELEKCIGV